MIKVYLNRKVSETQITIGNQYESGVNAIDFDLSELKQKWPNGNIYLLVSRKKHTWPYSIDDGEFKIEYVLTWKRGFYQMNVVVTDEKITDQLESSNTIFVSDTINAYVNENQINAKALNEQELPRELQIVYDDLITLKKNIEKDLADGKYIGPQGPRGEKGEPGEKGDPGDVTEEYRNLASQIAQNASDAQASATNAQISASNAQKILDDTKEFANQTKKELNQIKADTNTLKEEANASAVNAKASETKAKEYADNLQASTEDISKLKEDLVEQGKQINKLKVIIKRTDEIKDMTWNKVQKIVSSGAGETAFEIGAQLIEKWTDTADSKEYDMPWQVNNFEDVILENGEIVPGMWIQTHYTLPFGIQFSHQRAFLACPNGLSAGTYNFDFAKVWGNNVKPGINYQFTLTKPVEKGGRLAGCYGTPDQAPSNWKVYSYGANGITLNETVNVTVGSGGTNLGTIQYDSRSGNLNSVQEMAYGHNRWKTSALRQYLNSNKPKGQWWTPQDQWDICPDQLASKDGFLCGMPEEMLKYLKKVKVSTFANIVNDESVEDITYDYVIIPSMEQMYCQPQISGEGVAHDYWKRRSGRNTPCQRFQTYPNMISYSVNNHTSAQYVRLRSGYREYAFSTWIISSNGNVNATYGSGPIALSPLICIT